MSAALFVVAALALLHALLAAWSAIAARSDAAAIDWLEGTLAAAVSGVVFTGWLAVLLASLGWFSLGALAALLLATTAALWLGLRPGLRPSFRRIAGREWVALALLAACAAFYSRPHEYVLGGSDPGTYVSMAGAMARDGSLIVRDEGTGFLAEHRWLALRQQPEGWTPKYIQLVGWFIDDRDPTRLIPQFLPFHPALMAIGMGLGGLRGALLATPLWALLGLAAVFLAARRLFGATTALLALALLAATPTQLYFARYPSTEPLALLLLWTGLLAYQHVLDEGGLEWGLLGGAAFGAALLTRIDLPLVAALVALALIAAFWQGRWNSGWTAFSLAFGLLASHAAWHQLGFAWPYTRNCYAALIDAWQGLSPQRASGLVAGAAILTAAMLGVARSLRALEPTRRTRALRLLRAGLAAAAVALSVFAYFLRPLLQSPTESLAWPALVRFPVSDGENWVRVGWYLTPLGLVLATLGLARLLLRFDLGRLGLYLAIGTGTVLQFVTRLFSTPYHLYAMRRFVPIAMPTLVVFAAVAITAPLGWRRRRAGVCVSASLAVLLLGGMLRAALPVLRHRDLAGAAAQLAALEARLRPGAILLVSEPTEALFADTFGIPLRFLFGHDIVTLHRSLPRAQFMLDALVDRATRLGRPLQAIAVDPMLAQVPRFLDLRPVGVVPVVVQALVHSFDGPPTEMQTARYEVEIYDVARRDPVAAAASHETLVDVGGMDTPFLVAGFFGKEPVDPRLTGRWAGGLAALQVPVGDAQTATIEVRAISYRPPSAPPGRVEVELDGIKLGAFVPPTDWQTFRFSGPLASGDPFAVVALRSETFNPRQLGVNGDARDLGVYVDWIRVVPQNASASAAAAPPGTAP